MARHTNRYEFDWICSLQYRIDIAIGFLYQFYY